VDFANRLEKATLDTIESGKMTGDLGAISSLENIQVLNSEEFIHEIAKKLQ
jgi:isocitrate dehydrogenase [NADP]